MARLALLSFIFFLFVGTVHSILAPESVSGLAGSALQINYGTSIKLPYELSASLANSFTFETWLYLPQDDYRYRPIVSRGLGTSNAFADFLLMVNLEGALVFFMGNGGAGTYGVIMSLERIPTKKWTHIAFSIHTEDWENNPDKITVYIDGRPFQEKWGLGNRQFRSDKAVFIASFTNENSHWFHGFLDEIRIWDEYRTEMQIQAFKNFVAPRGTKGLKAYYSCNTPDKKLLRDGTDFQNHGQIVRTSGEGLQWGPSEVKIHMTRWFKTKPGFSARESITLGKPPSVSNCTYFIETLPSEGRLVDPYLKPLPTGPTDLPFQLDTGTVLYDAPLYGVLTYFKFFVVCGTSSMPGKAKHYVRSESVSTEYWIRVNDPMTCGECRC